MTAPMRTPAAPNPGIPALLDLLKTEKVNPNKVFVAAWKVFAEQLENESDPLKQASIAAKCITVYVAAVKAIPEIMHEFVASPAGAFLTAKNSRPMDAGGVLGDKKTSMATRLPKPGSFTE